MKPELDTTHNTSPSTDFAVLLHVLKFIAQKLLNPACNKLVEVLSSLVTYLATFKVASLSVTSSLILRSFESLRNFNYLPWGEEIYLNFRIRPTTLKLLLQF